MKLLVCSYWPVNCFIMISSCVWVLDWLVVEEVTNLEILSTRMAMDASNVELLLVVTDEEDESCLGGC